jgi:hypothetical protein
MAYRPEIEKSKSGQVLVRTCGEKMQASDGKTDPQKQPEALSWGAMCCCNPAPFKRIITKSGQVLVRTCGERTQASHGKTDPQKQPGALSWGAMCCCNPAPFKRIITKSGQVLVRSKRVLEYTSPTLSEVCQEL